MTTDDNGNKGNFDDDIYTREEFNSGLPKNKFPSTEDDPRTVYAAVHDELMLDGNARQNLATFCQTWEEPEIHQLM
ncbi:MAG: glutamate decarboxylase, partial [Gammaproteobacteria bacterium]